MGGQQFHKPVKRTTREVCPLCLQYGCPSLAGRKTSDTRFAEALQRFVSAGHALVEAWDDGAGFNADVMHGAAVTESGEPLFPISVDEWLLELQAWGEGKPR